MKCKSTFLGQTRPFVTCMVAGSSPNEIITTVRNAVYDGADSFGFQICRLEPQYRTKEGLQSIFRPMGNRPIYVTNYRSGYNADKTDDELAQGLLFELECGATLLDVMGDLYCRDPREITYDSEAVRRQKELIEEIHKRGGEVLMSSHLYRYADMEEVLEIAHAHQERGADISKIVCAANTEEEEMEALRIIMRLKKELDIPFLFLVGGSYCNRVRQLGPLLGCFAWLTVQTHTPHTAKVQPVCRAIRQIADHFDDMPDRSF